MIYESGPQILTGETKVFKMWFTEGGFSNPTNIRYAESTDGESWTISPTVILQNKARPNIYREGGDYWLFVTSDDRSAIELYRSTSELIQSTDKVADVLTTGNSGWDAGVIGNHTTWKEGSTYYMMYEAMNGSVWEMGEATSTDGVNWTKSGDNPTLQADDFGFTGAVGGPDIHVIDGDYYLWFHLCRSGNTPTDGAMTKSADRRTWDEGRKNPTFKRTEAWEGNNQPGGQIADITVVEHPDLSQTHMWYAGAFAQETGAFNIGHATVDLTRKEIYNTSV